VGHPLAERLPLGLPAADARVRLGLDPAAPTVALLPGSRPHELRHHLPPLVGAARRIARQAAGAQFVIPCPESRDRELLVQRLPADLRVVVSDGGAGDALAAADVVLTKTGTSTLEAALLGRPMVTFYTGGLSMKVEYVLRGGRRALPRISMPNILADEDLVLELRSGEVTALRLAQECLE
jgi:lipid-A-disaccharide synthase